ncbi:hypothetical protein [Tenacibaculum amylolyticum]|uniref:hypothetical protein n=1 Tax=Tenacibaculum amylolyticum TaxID=104269 RepID=UPI003893AAEC
MKQLLFIGKIISILIFGFFAAFSVIMFPLLVGSQDTSTAIIGYSYLGIFLFSITILYLIVKYELKNRATSR